MSARSWRTPPNPEWKANMKRALTLLLLVTAIVAAHPAHARKACEELKQEIAAKIEANGVQAYNLEIVAADADAVGELKVVGSCNGGTQRIVYERGKLIKDAPQVAATSPGL